MKSNINETELKYYPTIPSVWGGVIGYQYATTHYDDGWRDLVTPEIDHDTEKLGELIYDEANDVVTYEVIEKTKKEIDDDFRRNAIAQRRIAIQRFNEIKVEELLSEMGDEEAIQNIELFPIWESGISVKQNDRYQCLCDDLHIHLFKCLNDHVTDINPEQSENWIKL